MTDPGSGQPGGRAADDETRPDWPVPPSAAPDAGAPSVDELPELPPAPEATFAGMTTAAAPPPAPPPGPPPPAPVGAPPGPGPGQYQWQAVPPAADSRYAVPGVPGLQFAGVGSRIVALLVDAFLLGIAFTVVAGAASAAVPRLADTPVLYTVLAVGVDAVYFIGLWSSGSRATLGMRLLKLQVGNAFDGRRLDSGQSLRRWIALGYWLPLLGITPTLANVSALASLIWVIVLLVTTISSPTRQGFHDRFANSAVVQPVGTGSGVVLLGCLLLIALWILGSIVALIFLGSQVSTILSTVGDSVYP